MRNFKFSSRGSVGFSLIELMIAVAIVGILTMVAYPSYQNYIIKGNRSAAQAFMMEVANKEKQYLLDARTYASTLAELGVTAPPEVSKHYTVAVATTATPPAFTITATPSGTQASDGALTLDSSGGKSPSNKW